MKSRAIYINNLKNEDRNINEDLYRKFWDTLIEIIERINVMIEKYDYHITKNNGQVSEDSVYGITESDKVSQNNSDIMTKLRKLESTDPDTYNDIMKNLGLEL